MNESQYKCITGRYSRLVSCLAGFTDLVKINISSSDQISNIIILTRNKLADNYNVLEHKQMVEYEMKERGYGQDVIDKWIIYI